MTILRMARCIGRSGCDGEPGARGLCHTCYQRHKYKGTLAAFPTMTERAAALKERNQLVARQTKTPTEYSRDRRVRNRAERVLLNGYLVHPNTDHGTVNAYTSYSCRGPLCRAAQRWYRETGDSVHPWAHMRRQSAEDCVRYTEWGDYR